MDKIKRCLLGVVLGLMAGAACGGAPSTDVAEVQSAQTFYWPPNGGSWYDAYWTTTKVCAGTQPGSPPSPPYQDGGVGAYYVRTTNVGWLAGVTMEDSIQVNPWTHQYALYGAMPDPGHWQPGVAPPECRVKMFSFTDADCDSFHIPRGSWVMDQAGNQVPCAVKILGVPYGPLQPWTIQGQNFFVADWRLAPTPFGYHFHSAGRIYDGDRLTTCTYEANADLYQAPVPHQ